MNSIVIPWLFVLAGIFTLFVYILVIALLKVVKQVTETNKQLLIVVAGKDAKPEALRALVTSNKPPRGKLSGISGKDKTKDNKPKNTDFVMEIGT